MALGISFRSRIKHTIGPNPIKFTKSNSDEQVSLQDLIEQSVPDLKDGGYYWSHPLFVNGHLQTAYAAVDKFANRDQIYYKRQILELPDNACIAIDHVVKPDDIEAFNSIDNDKLRHPTQKLELPPRTKYFTEKEVSNLPSNDSKPLMIVLHGLSGGSYESYIRCFLNKLTNDPYNFEALVINARGCANSSLATPQLFCGLWTDDVRYLVKHLSTIYPNRKLYAIGCSLGGTILSNYLGQESDESKITAAAILACPWDLNDSSVQLRNSFIGDKIYSKAMTQNLVELVEKHLPELEGNIVMNNFHENKLKVSKLSEFDDFFTARTFGFNCASEYYRHGSSVNRLFANRTPMLILNALDDPIASSATLPFSEVTRNPYTLMITTSLGGHLGWFNWKRERFYSDPLSQYFYNFHHNLDHDSLEVDPNHLPIKNNFKVDRIMGVNLNESWKGKLEEPLVDL